MQYDQSSRKLTVANSYYMPYEMVHLFVQMLSTDIPTNSFKMRCDIADTSEALNDSC